MLGWLSCSRSAGLLGYNCGTPGVVIALVMGDPPLDPRSFSGKTAFTTLLGLTDNVKKLIKLKQHGLIDISATHITWYRQSTYKTYPSPGAGSPGPCLSLCRHYKLQSRRVLASCGSGSAVLFSFNSPALHCSLFLHQGKLGRAAGGNTDTAGWISINFDYKVWRLQLGKVKDCVVMFGGLVTAGHRRPDQLVTRLTACRGRSPVPGGETSHNGTDSRDTLLLNRVYFGILSNSVMLKAGVLYVH